MLSRIIRRLAGWTARPATPPYGDWRVDPRHPANAGWERSDIDRSARPVRFRFALGDAPKVAPPAVPITGFGFISAESGGHAEHKAELPKQTARPVPPRTGISTAPRADSFYGRVRG